MGYQYMCAILSRVSQVFRSRLAAKSARLNLHKIFYQSEWL
jgi:hypothetical protein